MKQYLINFLKFSLFLGVGLAILYWVYLKQEAAYQEDCALKGIAASECSLIQKIIDDFKVVNYFWVLVVLFAFIISNISRAIRWRMLLRPMGYQTRLSNAFLTIMLGYFANLGLPRLGEIVRAGTMAKYENIPMEKVVGTVVLGRLIDVIFLLMVIGLAFLIEFETLWNYLQEHADLSGLLGGLRILALVGIVGALLLYVFRRQISQLSIYHKFKNIVIGFWEGIQTIARLEQPILFLLHSMNIWIMYFLMTYLCFFAFAPTAHLGPGVGLMTFVMGAIAITIPSPGGMGTYHFLVTSILTLYGIAEADAFSFANILFFSVQLGVNVLLGLVALLILPMLNRNYQPVVATTSDDAS
ncbi:MAG: lysylphosphatidylglycerol synthase transmembrane domain-containing protein [Bacteroidota bacterium]